MKLNELIKLKQILPRKCQIPLIINKTVQLTHTLRGKLVTGVTGVTGETDVTSETGTNSSRKLIYTS